VEGGLVGVVRRASEKRSIIQLKSFENNNFCSSNNVDNDNEVISE
jgi:hypothetical protein